METCAAGRESQELASNIQLEREYGQHVVLCEIQYPCTLETRSLRGLRCGITVETVDAVAHLNAPVLEGRVEEGSILEQSVSNGFAVLKDPQPLVGFGTVQEDITHQTQLGDYVVSMHDGVLQQGVALEGRLPQRWLEQGHEEDPLDTEHVRHVVQELLPSVGCSGLSAAVAVGVISEGVEHPGLVHNIVELRLELQEEGQDGGMPHTLSHDGAALEHRLQYLTQQHW
uniref:CTP synthase n=1 Tax=Lygus hesperus TaxID=30085 RepID=A0A0A9X019_LYGHE